MNNLNLYSETVSGYTAVSDIFIDEYVPSANGDFVKVYLYALMLCYHPTFHKKEQ